jgi:hypothetical protein
VQHPDDAPKDLLLLIVDWKSAHFLGCPKQSSEHSLLGELRRFRRWQKNCGASKEWTPFFVMYSRQESGYDATNDLPQRAAHYKVSAAYIKAFSK